METATASKPPQQTAPRILLWIVAVAFFMQMLDATILNTALPSVATGLGVTALRMQSVVIAYMLTCALLVPAAGWLADRFGAKRIFILAIAIFTLGSLFCAISSSLKFMVLARVFQGAGGALMVPVGRLIAIRAYPRSELVRVLSFITIPGLVGPLLGPVAGGLLVQYASWHWIFLINLPVGLVGGFLAWRYMSESKAEGESQQFDALGFLLFGGSMVSISMGMEGLGELHLPKVQATLLCIVGLALMALYWVRAARVPAPLFPPSLFHTRSFAVGILGNVFSRLGSGAMPFLMPLFLQLVLGFSPMIAGLTMIPTAVASFLGKGVVGKLVRRFGFRSVLTVNTLLLGVMIASFSMIGEHTAYPLLLGHLFLFGTVNSIQFTVMNSVTLVDLTDDQTTEGNGMLSVTMQIANGCGVAMAAALLDGFLSPYGGDATREQLGHVFEKTFFWVGTIGVVTSAIFSQLPGKAGEQIDENRQTEVPPG